MKRKADKSMAPYHRCRYVLVAKQPDGSWALVKEGAFCAAVKDSMRYVSNGREVRLLRYGPPVIVFEGKAKGNA